MKKTQLIELLKTIKGTLVSFISIAIFVALSVAIFNGTAWASKGVLNSINAAYDSTNYRDIEILFPYGIEDKDIEVLANAQGVDEIEGSYTGYAYFNLDGEKYQAKLTQIHEKIDFPYNFEGVLPTKYNEIGMDKTFAEKKHLKIGDKIQFISDVKNDEARAIVRILDFNLEEDNLENLEEKSDSSMAYLKTDTFTITAFTISSDYLSVNESIYGVSYTDQTPVNCCLFLPKESFDEKSFAGYPNVIIKSNELEKYDTFTNEYKEKADELKSKLQNEIVDKIVKDKNEAIRVKIKNIKNDAQNKLDVAQNQIKIAEKKISDGRKALADGKAQLDKTKDELINAEKQLDVVKGEFENKLNEFNRVNSIYTKIKKEVIDENEIYFIDNIESILEEIKDIEELAIKYKDKEITIKIENTLREKFIEIVEGGLLKNIKDEIIQIFDVIDSGVNNAKNQIEAARKQLEEAENEIDAYWIEYEKGINEYENKKKELIKAEKLLEEEKTKYIEAVEKFNTFVENTSDIQEYGCALFTRSYNANLTVAKTLSDLFGNLKYTMAGLFVCVGLLICYTAISRIIHDQTVIIGTKKALGFSQKEIILFYLSYTGASVLIGCVVGNIFGYALIEKVLINAVQLTFICDFKLYFSLKEVFVSSFIEIVLLITVTIVACRSILKENAVKLLTGQEFVNGKERVYEKTKLWNKLPLLTKIIINNFFNEKRRVFGTIVSIAGATSLIVTALTLNNNILDSFKVQYSDLHHFDTIITFDVTDDQAKKEIIKVFDENNIDYAEILYSRIFTETDNGTYVPTILFVTEDYEQLNKMMTRIPTNKNDANLNEGLWMSKSYESYYKPNKNDPISFVSLTGIKADVVPTGYFENYLTYYHVVMDRDSYIEYVGEELKCDSFIINTFDLDRDELINKIQKTPGYICSLDYYDFTKGSFEAFETVSNALIIIYTALSALMSLLVLLNLLIMFVNEKKRELITLMINGYALKDAKKYIYSDTIFLTIVSSIVGCVIGSFMGMLTVTSFESNITVFLHKVNYEACLIASITTFLFTFIVSMIALRKISKFKLTDINKQ